MVLDPFARPPQYSVSSWRARALVVFPALLSGFLSGLFGTGGPPLMIFVAFSGINKNEWRASGCAMTVLIMPFRLVYLFHLRPELLDSSEFVGYATSTVLSLIGLYVGNRINKHVSPTMFDQGLLILLAVASLLMLSAGSETGVAVLSVMLGACALLAAAAWLFRRGRRSPAVTEHSASSAAPYAASEVGGAALSVGADDPAAIRPSASVGDL